MAGGPSEDPVKDSPDTDQDIVADTYGNFRELAGAEKEGEAWTREYLDRGSRILVMAPHGGWIEPFTSELAEAVAGHDLSFYTFRAVKRGANQRLHLTSHRFDDPLALTAVGRALRVLAIHGEANREAAFVMVGGGWEEFAEALRSSLSEAGFTTRRPRKGLAGRHPKNICNKGRLGPGVQLEISEALRRELRQDPGRMEHFVEVVRRGILVMGEGANP
jgi:phage replication-related protein YjqB (UPF0714/DUF867 family)